MAISGTITGATESATFNSSNGVSDVVVTSRHGACYLEVQAGAGEWTVVSGLTGSYNVLTPDPALNYRFRGVDGTDADYYIGP